jgi:D-alanine-D-alanine ligase
MKIGLTYDLRQDYLDLGYGEEETAEFDRVDTVEAIERTLQDLGYETDRIGNIWNLTKRLAAGERWDLVFNIAEGLRGIGREAQVPALLDAYDIPYTFSDPLVLALTLHKGMTKRVIRDLGIPTPDFAEVKTEADIDEVDLPFPVFAKPIAEGTGKGITSASKIQSQKELRSVCRRILTEYKQPVLVETFLPGREFTVGLVGTGKNAKVVGVMEVILKPNAEKDVYSYINKEKYVEFVGYIPVNDLIAKRASEIALEAWRGLGCRDAGRIDLRSDSSGIPNFIEVNPLAGIHPIHSDLVILCRLVGIKYSELIEMIINEALTRLIEKPRVVIVKKV